MSNEKRTSTGQLLPAPKRLFGIHYSSAIGDPPIFGIIVQEVATEYQTTFSVPAIAKELGFSGKAIRSNLERFEKILLRRFSEFVRSHPSATWLHWGMRKATFGFDVIFRRMKELQIKPPSIPGARHFDLQAYLKRTYGDNFAPHPRLREAAKLNECWEPAFLSDEETKAAWKRGDYGKIVRSLSEKVDSICDLYRRVRAKTFQRAEPGKGSTPLADQLMAPSASTRPKYERDRLFLLWYETRTEEGFRSHAKIRDRWNREHPEARLALKGRGREVVKKGIQKARAERAKAQEKS